MHHAVSFGPHRAPLSLFFSQKKQRGKKEVHTKVEERTVDYNKSNIGLVEAKVEPRRADGFGTFRHRRRSRWEEI